MALSNAQYNEIMQGYSDRQMADYREQQERIREAYRSIPELQVLDESVSRQAVTAAERMAAGEKTAAEELKRRIAEIRTRKLQLLKEHGLPEDYMELRFQCRDCQDTGFVKGEKCHCFRAQQMKLLYRQSHIDQVVERENFKTFNLSIFDNRETIDAAGNKTNRQYMREVAIALHDYCENFEQEKKNILLMGPAGTGKTFLINCIARELMDRYHSVIYLSSTDLVESFSHESYDSPEEKQDMNDAILNCDCLCIDDLGAEFSNSFTNAKLFYVLNQRMVYHRPVIISTNLNFRELRDSYTDRIASRLMSAYEIFPLYGQDQRLNPEG